MACTYAGKLSNSEWWTMGESNSRHPDANRAHCHYANGPYWQILADFKALFHLCIAFFS